MSDLGNAIQNIWASDYVQRNPNKAYKTSYQAEYNAVAAYINGGARPTGAASFSRLGRGLVEAEDVRRGTTTLPPPIPPPDPGTIPAGTLFASPSGNDSTGDGSLAKPFATMEGLSHALRPGGTGMLRGGTYPMVFAWSTGERYNGGPDCNGTAAQRITITNYPGEKVVYLGTWGFGGSFTTLRNIYIDPTNKEYKDPSGEHCGTAAQVISVEGKDIIIEDCDIYYSGDPSVPTKGKASGLYVYDTADRLVIRRNLIHDVGGCFCFDHGVYLGGGAYAEITQNWIWNDLNGWGMQIYPHSNNAKIHGNVIYNCGGGFVVAGEGGPTCHDNDLFQNVVMNCPGMTTKTGFFIPGAGSSGVGTPGPNNKFRDSIVFGCQYVVEPHSVENFAVISGNQTVDPQFVDAANHNFLLRPGSPAAGFGLPTVKPGPNV